MDPQLRIRPLFFMLARINSQLRYKLATKGTTPSLGIALVRLLGLWLWLWSWCILCEAQAVDMHLFLFAASEKSSRAFSKFEIVRMEPLNWEACARNAAAVVAEPCRTVTCRPDTTQQLRLE